MSVANNIYMKITDRIKLAVKAFNTQGTLGNSTGTVLRNYAKGSTFNPQVQLTGITYKAVEKISQAVSLYEPIVTRRNGDAYENHPLLALFNKPNPQQNASDFLMLGSFYYEIYGETFIYLARGESTNKVKEMYHLNPAQMELAIHKGEVVGYKLHKSDGNQIPFELDEIIHDKRPNPFNEWRGMSVMERASVYIDTEITTSTFTLNYMRNNASPSGIVTLPSMDRDTFKQFAQQWREGYEGPQNAGKTAFVRGEGVDFKAVGATLKDVDQEITRRMSKDDVLMMFDVPKGLLGMGDSKGLGTNEIEPLEYIFAKYNTEPRMRRLDRVYEQILANQKGNGLQTDTDGVTHESPIPDDKRFKLEQHEKGVNKWLTVNEVREQQGLPPLDGYDELVQPASPFTMQETKAKKVTLKKEATKKDPETFRQELMTTAEIYAIKVKRAISKFMAGQEKQVVGKIDASNKAFEEWLFTLKTESEQMAKLIAPILYDLIEEQGAGTASWVTGESFRLTAEMKATVNDRIVKLAGKVNEDTLRALEATITEGVSKGESVVKLKKRIEDTYKPLKGARAERIARTESIRTSNMTAEEVYRQNGSTKVKWFVNADACEYCEAMADEVKVIGDNFKSVGDVVDGAKGGQMQLSYDDISSPPLHPHCGCSILAVD